MSSQQIIENKWNKIFVDFLSEISILFPDSPAESLKTKFQMSQFLGGKKPIIVFLDHLDEHSSEIETENEEYFFGDNETIEFVKQLQLDKYYGLSNDTNRKVIWKYIKTLYQLSKIYNTL